VENVCVCVCVCVVGLGVCVFGSPAWEGVGALAERLRTTRSKIPK